MPLTAAIQDRLWLQSLFACITIPLPLPLCRFANCYHTLLYYITVYVCLHLSGSFTNAEVCITIVCTLALSYDNLSLDSSIRYCQC